MNSTRSAYCTIITPDFLHYALALRHSLTQFRPEIVLTALIADEYADVASLDGAFDGLRLLSVQDLCADGIGKRILEKYGRANVDCFRWSMKPVLLNHLLSSGFEQAFFLDPDLFFFSDFTFLEHELGERAVLLTPHWRASQPELDENNFAILQTSGLFNAGFVGVAAAGRSAMTWWAKLCLYRCEKQPSEGLFVDQAYLDMMPVYFNDVAIERHRGCNVANWNRLECARVSRPDGTVGIAGGWDIVFIHFTQSTIKGIESGEDALLRPFLAGYLSALGYWKHEVESHAYGLALRDGTLGRLTQSADAGSGKAKLHTPPLSVCTLDIFQVRSAIERALRQVLPNLHGSVLDVGCGDKPYKDILVSPSSRVTRYIGLDLDDSPIHNNQPEITWRDGKIPLDPASVDCAICTEVLEHCPDPDAVLHEVHRVLKPGGLLFFTVPFLWPLHEVPYDHYRYTPYALERHLANSGFEQIEIHAMGGWDASLAQMLGLWVRRRAMGRLQRAILSVVIYPVYRWLVHLDNPASISFKESQMLTGLWGTAVKQEGRKANPAQTNQAAPAGLHCADT
ncbi:class I SAM-dependent methyltransferase [Thiocapsa marina]|uniref:Methyltransferase type 11 n=1 Tax=Thiocapsa marina 5811 TaxID=768671 RepID=F9UEY1_9GAMM|nr:class I SAM-dependent methyltransferase [Thiocapsa marina]EGV17452.1 Methyltransferase type 11 [Thiocapsa marina 5811]